MWVDSHAHLSQISKNDFLKQLNSAMIAGVTGIINIGTNIEESQTAIERAGIESPVKTFAAIGVCVPESGGFVENFDWVERLQNLAKSPNVAAIGETGIDGAKKDGYPPLEIQIPVFKKQIELAKKLDKPLIVHSRMQDEEALEMCVSAGIKKALFHCFTGTVESAKKITRAGYFISFSGIVTFVKNGLDETVKSVPLDRMLIETDSPWLAPAPYRGKQNEPAYVRFVGEKIAQIYGIDKEVLAKTTKENAEKFFGIAF